MKRNELTERGYPDSSNMPLGSTADLHRSTASIGSRASKRKGNGALQHEGMPGIDTFYDAFESTNIAGRFGPGKQTWCFQTAVPRPWQKPPNLNFGHHLGPGDYDIEKSNHNHLLSSSSLSWSGRGRTGPMGNPFDRSRLSPQFASVTSRLVSDSSTKQPSKLVKEDIFVTRSDARREALLRNDWSQTLSRRAQHHAVTQTLSRPPPPKIFDFFSGAPATPPMTAP